MATYPVDASRYLDGRVSTASQPELQLMLLEGAVRFVRQAEELWEDATQIEESHRLVQRASDIVGELIRGVTLAGTEISKRLDEEYAFAFRRLALAQINHDRESLDDARRLLEFHRDTWRLACERVRDTLAVAAVAAPHVAFSAIEAPLERLSLQG